MISVRTNDMNGNVHSRVLVLIHNLHAHAKEIKVKGQGRLDGNGKD
jgi:DNA-binding protein